MDVDAGIIIILEAGGKVTDFYGKSFDKSSPELLASNGKLYEKILDLISSRSVTE